MRSSNKAWLAAAGALALASCGTPDRPHAAGGGGRGVSDLPVKIGPAYQVGGRTYVPRDDRGYDATGYASWYGAAHRGKPTANGERFDPQAISAAHTTLPLPSYVTVTALDTGRTILVRINDRGPFAAGRIIDLSQGAARLLGVERAGVARVRVRRVNPSEADRAALRAGRPAGGRGGAAYAEARVTPSGAGPSIVGGAATAIVRPPAVMASSIEAEGTDLAAMPAPVTMQAAPAPVSPTPSTSLPGLSAPSSSFFVQVAAFADPDRADALASLLRPIGTATATAAGPAWRVRLGPYASEADALSALARARRAGYQDARVVRESAP